MNDQQTNGQNKLDGDLIFGAALAFALVLNSAYRSVISRCSFCHKHLPLPYCSKKKAVFLSINEMTDGSNERSPLLQNGHANGQQEEPEA